MLTRCALFIAASLLSQVTQAADPFLDYVGPQLNLPPAISAVAPSRDAGIVEASTRSSIDGLWYVCNFEQVRNAGTRPYWGVRGCALSDGTRVLTRLVRGGSGPGLPSDPEAPDGPGSAGAVVVSAFTRGNYGYKFTYKWLQTANGSWEWVITEVTITWNGNVPPPVQQ